MDDAIRTAGLLPEDISYINAHGTGTLMNDRAEAEALVTTFGSGCPPTSSTKPVTGHCLGASPVLEAILCIHALQQQLVPPTANCHDPEFPIDIVTLRARPAPLQHVLSNSLGFWGKHASLVFSR
jgi:3-oxoacyl-(acyl-carrier-protein) synthase